MICKIPTRTGVIYSDADRRLEFLAVGDYGKAKNIKADFLGLQTQINGVEHSAVDITKKLVLTMSTQKGCCCRCAFCDVPRYGFYGNATIDDLKYQVETALQDLNVAFTERLNIHFARMGEPTYNFHVIDFTKTLKAYCKQFIDFDTVHPVVSTMMPKANSKLCQFLKEWCEIKNDTFKGEAGLQLSIQSTDDKQRKFMFNDMSMNLTDVAKVANSLPKPVGRKYTLNFAITEKTKLDAKLLSDFFDKEKFIVKITPIHPTAESNANGFDITTTYNNYDVYKQFEEPLLAEGWDVIVFVPSKEESEDKITCGNALIANNK